MSATLVLAVLCAAAPVADSKTSRTWHQLVGVLQYVEGDYRKAIALHDLEEPAEQKLNIATAKGLLHSLKDSAAPYEARLDSIQERTSRPRGTPRALAVTAVHWRNRCCAINCVSLRPS